MDDQNLVYADAVLIKMSKTIVAYAYRTVARHGTSRHCRQSPFAACSCDHRLHLRAVDF